jgi:hypothetical protein
MWARRRHPLSCSLNGALSLTDTSYMWMLNTRVSLTWREFLDGVSDSQ